MVTMGLYLDLNFVRVVIKIATTSRATNAFAWSYLAIVTLDQNMIYH